METAVEAGVKGFLDAGEESTVTSEAVAKEESLETVEYALAEEVVGSPRELREGSFARHARANGQEG